MEDRGQAALLLVANCAEQEELIVEQQIDGLLLSIPVMLNDGAIVSFHIQITFENGKLCAKETPSKPQNLPPFCPERHINGDGSFCLSWGKDDPLQVQDQDSARRWLETLTTYLRTQLRVNNRRIWPGSSWAHGEAADHQLSAQQVAASLGPEFLDELKSARLHVEMRTDWGSDGGALYLYRDDQLCYAVWNTSGRVARFRQDVSGKRRRKRWQHLRSERNAVLIGQLATALWKWKKAENNFWNSFRDRECCGTMDGCPLRDPDKKPETH